MDKGKMAIARMLGNYKMDKPIRVEIQDNKNNTICVLYLSYENYAKATTGTYVECDIERYDNG